MAKAKTTPIKITARMLDGRLNSTDGIVMFDAILYHGWFAKHAPHVLDGGGKEQFTGYFGLPLRQLPLNRWAASMGIYKELGKEVDAYNKRPDFFAPEKIGHLNAKGLVSSSVGRYRAWRMPQVIRTIEDGIIEFYALGHKDEIATLLGSISGVAKKNAIGYGVIEDWHIDDCDADYTLYHPLHGLMRPALPDEIGEIPDIDMTSIFRTEYAVRPPYWKACNVMECYLPTRVLT